MNPSSSRGEDAPLSGALVVHKEKDYTSHDVVQIARRVLGIRKIGHTGTLDPAAEGLLVLLVGKATKSQQELQGHSKVYDAQIHLGAQTDTGDAEGEVVVEAPVPDFDESALTAILKQLEGEQVQRVPAYSAVKINGKPAYWWARRQQPVELPQRTIHLSKIELQAFTPTSIDCRVHCTAGTYVRVLAETVAEALGTVGHLSGLVRRQIGAVTLEQAVSMDWLKTAGRAAVEARLVAVESLR